MLVEYYRFQMGNPISKLNFQLKTQISNLLMGSDGCHGPQGVPPAPPGVHDTPQNPLKNGKLNVWMGNPILKWGFPFEIDNIRP